MFLRLTCSGCIDGRRRTLGHSLHQWPCRKRMSKEGELAIEHVQALGMTGAIGAWFGRRQAARWVRLATATATALRGKTRSVGIAKGARSPNSMPQNELTRLWRCRLVLITPTGQEVVRGHKVEEVAVAAAPESSRHALPTPPTWVHAERLYGAALLLQLASKLRHEQDVGQLRVGVAARCGGLMTGR